MPRITKTYLVNRFNRVAAAMGWDIEGSAWSRDEATGRNVAKVGHVSLQHNTFYGWNVSQICNEGGGERRLIESCKATELDAVFTGILLAKEAGR
jgi:hypothetical protein